MSEENVESFKRLVEAWNRDDFDARLIRRRNLEAMGDLSESMTRCSTTELRATRERMDARKAERVEARDEQARRYLACHESEADWQDDESQRR